MHTFYKHTIQTIINIRSHLKPPLTQSQTYAAQADAVECLKALLAVPGVDVNLTKKKGKTPLMMAAYKGSEVCLDLLLKAGAKLDLRGGKQSMTALEMALRTSIAEWGDCSWSMG